MVNIAVSHTAARGSIPRIGITFCFAELVSTTDSVFIELVVRVICFSPINRPLALPFFVTIPSHIAEL